MAKFDPPHVRARLAVDMTRLLPGMIFQHPEGRGEYWKVIEAQPPVSDKYRLVTVERAGGRMAGESASLVLYPGEYQVRPHAALLRPGDLVTVNRRSGRVLKISPVEFGAEMLHVVLEGFGATPRQVFVRPFDLVSVKEWGS